MNEEAGDLQLSSSQQGGTPGILVGRQRRARPLGRWGVKLPAHAKHEEEKETNEFAGQGGFVLIHLSWRAVA